MAKWARANGGPLCHFRPNGLFGLIGYSAKWIIRPNGVSAKYIFGLMGFGQTGFRPNEFRPIEVGSICCSILNFFLNCYSKRLNVCKCEKHFLFSSVPIYQSNILVDNTHIHTPLFIKNRQLKVTVWIGKNLPKQQHNKHDWKQTPVANRKLVNQTDLVFTQSIYTVQNMQSSLENF
jgi:hypothetical protein